MHGHLSVFQGGFMMDFPVDVAWRWVGSGCTIQLDNFDSIEVKDHKPNVQMHDIGPDIITLGRNGL